MRRRTGIGGVTGAVRAAGFTLLEVLIALSIVGALLAIAFSGMRVALSAWRQGEDRVEAHQHARGVAVTLARALGAAFPYQGSLGEAPEAVVLFNGREARIEFVTQAPPFPAAMPIAFTAVVISLEQGEQPGLVVRERVLPNRNPFSDATIAYRDPAITSIAVRYLDASGNWQEQWDGRDEKTLPRAVRLTLGTTVAGQPRTLPPLTVSLRAAPPL